MKGNSKMEDALQRITGHTVAKIHEDFQRDFYLSSSEAVQYGIIDEVLMPREKVRQEVYQQRGVSHGTAGLVECRPFFRCLLFVAGVVVAFAVGFLIHRPIRKCSTSHLILLVGCLLALLVSLLVH